MPTKPSRARRWIQSGKAAPFWKNGIFCVRLNVVPSDTESQEVVVGVDPGSKKEGFTVKSQTHTYLNVQADAHAGVGKKVEKRRELRRGRRSRKCPNRKNRTNRLANRKRAPAGTRARWDWKLRILEPDNIDIFCISPIPIRRRELHRQNPQKGGKRPRYGGTLCNGIVKNTLVKHIKHGLLRVTGYDRKGGINLSEINSSKRIVRGAKPNMFRIRKRLNFQYG